ncbi:DNA polymerase III subunit gamma/tau [Alloscardovia theropitheci]|uniref:DNA-directed DNA polymerase n=1 Tax=Alloscardovia theropitheci TaxID=2496842 RepID=A0A4R0QST3_9BIFI|nr:DNA polymerase III subunit gamma/tau [Alloscardovia theropitheci]TCD54538.1 DNA polymerase III subunit gamma/tau [Alloscardovia theropitheci]
MALALYRRYRPDTFEGVIGQDHVTKPLSKALDEGKLTHAYLFSGPRGCGKTSSARILARCINCAEGPTSHPCGKCDSCRDLSTNGPGSIDVVEIDAASHGSVDDARELRERAGFAPARDRYKIFILDEAHMVTSNGFNALLKIVEEPPEHVMFIFATTEPDKVIGTIRSRTHHYPFRLVPPEVMQPYLEDICSREGIKPEPGVLRLAMRAGGGSMRDTLSVLDQLMVGSVDGVITYQDSVALLGFTPDSLIGEAVDAVIEQDGPKLYGVIEKVVTGGFDPRKFVEDLLAYVRDLLVLSLAGSRAEAVLDAGQSAQTTEDMKRQVQDLDLQTLNVIAERINTALGSMTGTMSPRMRLELLAAQLLIPVSTADVSTQAHDNESSPRNARSAFVSNDVPRISLRQKAKAAARAKSRSSSSDDTVISSVSVPEMDTHRQNADEVNISDLSATAKNDSNSADNSQPHEASAQSVLQAVPQTTDTRGAHDDSRDVHNSQESATAVVELNPAEAHAQWEAVVHSLPTKIQSVVNSEHIPYVELQERSGRHLMVLTFANPISQHAFGLAVSSEAVQGETSLQKILNAQLRERYGVPVLVAPAPRTADGQTVTPLRNLDPAQQAKIKAQVAQMAAKAAIASMQALSTPTSHVEDGEHAASANSAISADDTESDQRAGFEVTQNVNSSDIAKDTEPAHQQKQYIDSDYDPWAVDSSARQDSSTQNNPEHDANTHSDQSVSEISQSGHAQEASNQYEDNSQTDIASVDSQAADEKTESTQIGDDYDPWAHSASNHEYGENYTAETHGFAMSSISDSDTYGDDHGAGIHSTAHSSARDSATHAHAQHAHASVATSSMSGDSVDSSVEAGANPGVETGIAHPQVDADKDVYSMDDDSISSQTNLSIDDISRMFNAKKTENYAADDERNPMKK